MLAVPGNWVAWVTALGLLMSGAAFTAARADQQDSRLDDLFARLKMTSNTTEAVALEQQIWSIWIEHDDRSVARLMRQGTVALSQGRLERALERFDQTVRLAPEFAEGWNKRATVLYLIGDYRASVVDIQRTLLLEPRHFGALSGLGLIYDAIEQPSAALRSFEAALALHPHLRGTRQRIEELRGQLSGRGT
jgi:tetratricopeptide (TPR) repeat protein